MAETSKKIAEKEIAKIKKNSEVSEAYFVGLLWSQTELYEDYKNVISANEFINDVWKFYFQLGLELYENNVKTFDDITVNKVLKEYELENEWKKYNGFETIEDVISIVEQNSNNIEYYFDEIKRTYTIQQLYLLFGEKVLCSNGKYQYEKMSVEQLTKYWLDKANQINLGTVNNYEAENLYIDAEEFLRRLEQDAGDMLPFYNKPMLNSITQGIPRGHLTFFGSFSGFGKTSFMSDAFVMSCIANNEKMLVILNEEDSQSFRQKIVLSILHHEFKTQIERRHMVNGKLTDEEKELVRKAFARMKELIDGDESLIKIIFIDNYVMSDVEKIVKFWANRGYISLLVDTHKITSEGKHDQRWVQFVEDAKAYYRLVRKNSGGANLRCVLNVQLSDSAIKDKYLTFSALAEGKGAKNEASIFFMMRGIHSDEYKGGKNELQCYKLVKHPLTGKYERDYFTLDDKEKTYMLVFTVKNRMGIAVDAGQPILVLESALHRNTFYERGWTHVAKDFG